MSKVVFTSASKQASLIREGSLKVTDLLELHFEQIDKLNSKINAIIWQDREAAYNLAKLLESEISNNEVRGPLHGVPVTIKESFDLAGAPSTWGNPALKDNLAVSDSDAVLRLKKAGAIVFGKTNVPYDLAEWQSFNQIYGTTNNPWDITRTPGGSSGGSAAALATGMTSLEVGSDIGSSIRNPAHYCGVFGHKPTFNVVSTKGHGSSHVGADISVAGPLARSAADLKLALDVIKGPNQFDSAAWALDLKRDKRDRLKDFSVGVFLDDPEAPIDKQYKEELEKFIEKIEQAGANVKRNYLPDLNTSKHFTLYLNLLGAALANRMSKKALKEKINGIHSLKNKQISRISGTRYQGLAMTHAEQLSLNQERYDHRLKFDNYFTDMDVIITPVASSTAFMHDQNGPRYSRFLTINGTDQPENNQLFWSGYSGVVGLPSTVGPIGLLDGLPAGYQAISGYGKDYTSLAFAMAVEREIHEFRIPPMCN